MPHDTKLAIIPQASKNDILPIISSLSTFIRLLLMRSALSIMVKICERGKFWKGRTILFPDNLFFWKEKVIFAEKYQAA